MNPEHNLMLLAPESLLLCRAIVGHSSFAPLVMAHLRLHAAKGWKQADGESANEVIDLLSLPDDALLEKIREMPQKADQPPSEEVASMLGAVFALRVIFKAKWAAAGHPVFAEEKPTQRVTDSVKDPLEVLRGAATLMSTGDGTMLGAYLCSGGRAGDGADIDTLFHVGPDQLRFGDGVHIRVLWLAGPIRFGDGAQVDAVYIVGDGKITHTGDGSTVASSKKRSAADMLQVARQKDVVE